MRQEGTTVAGLLERLWALLGDATSDPVDAVEALTVAYQQRLASLHEVRTELDEVMAARRRLAVAAGFSQAGERDAAGRDAELAAQEVALRRLSAALRDRLDEFRADRDRVQHLPDPAMVRSAAREALARWKRDALVLLHDAEDSYPEPSGFVSGEPATEGYEQPPLPGGGRR